MNNSQLIPPGYKQTEVGVIPKDWEVTPLGQLGSWKGGATPSMQNSAFWANGTIPWVSPGDVKRSLLFDTPMKITSHAVKNSSTTLLPVDSIIVVIRSGILRKYLPVAKNTLPLAINQDIKALIPAGAYVPDYLLHLLMWCGPRILATCLKYGTTVESVEFRWLKSFAIALPPTKAEQEAIAEALSDADALIESLEQLLAKKRLLKQGAMQEFLTGKKRLPGFSGEWEVKRIAEIASPSSEKNSAGERLTVLTCSKHLGFVDSLSYFKNQVFSKDTSGYKVIKRGQIGYPSNHVEEGSIGLQDVYDVALVSPIYVVFSVTEEVDSYFLHGLLKLDSYRQKFATATSSSVDRRGSLRWPAFSEITVSLPSVEEQIAIAAILSDMDAEIAALDAKLAKARHIKQGMMEELLTGRIRLVESGKGRMESGA